MRDEALYIYDGKRTIIVKDGRIMGVEKGIKKGAGKMISVDGAVVAPGFVDIHTHLREPGFEYKEDIESGAKSAVAGGFTTICCMPNTSPVNDNAGITEYILKRAGNVDLARIYPIGAISKGLKGESLADIGDMVSAGAVAISDDGRSVMNNLLFRRAVEYSSGFGISVMDHCEDVNLSSNGVMNEGSVSTALGLRGIPACAEEVHVARDIAIASQINAHIHITHISTLGSVELIRAAKKQKIRVTCDTTPHHLMLTEDAVRGYGTNFKVNPPLRASNDVKALLKGLIDGTIDCIATDHAPHSLVEKELPFESAAFGVVGLETALAVVLQFVHEKALSLNRAIELLSCGMSCLGKPFYGLKKGAPADITIFDPSAKVEINSSKFYSKSTNSSFNGWKLKGKVLYTIVGGRIVFDHEKGISSPS